MQDMEGDEQQITEDQPTARVLSPAAQARDIAASASISRSPELLHPQLGTYNPPPRQQANSTDHSQTRRPSSSYATAGTIEIPQAVFPPIRTLSSSSQNATRATEQRPPSDPVGLLEGAGVKADALPAVDEEQEDKLVTIKQEAMHSPVDASTADIHMSQLDREQQASKTVSSLKQEHTSRTQSPLREFSLAVPTTETSPRPPSMKKRPAAAKKKGTATAAKKMKGPAKKRKVDTVKANNKGGGKGTPAPSSPSHSAGEFDDDDESEVDSDEDVEGSGDVYCLCRKPDNGTFMIGCDGGCDDWFHGKCVQIEERDKNLIDKYICPRCTQRGIGQTSWKRMCRRQGCRLPARVGKNAGKNGETSKYCSDECGMRFFRQMLAQGRDADHGRSARRKTSAEDRTIAGAKGGVLNLGEVRAMLDQTNTAIEFRELGNGVLSPPATPTGSPAAENLTALEKEAVDKILAQKEQARQRHQILKDRLQYITIVKNEAGRAAEEHGLKPKEYCGFDSRLEWSEEEFAEWRHSPEGQRVFEQSRLEPVKLENGDQVMQDANGTVCTRKKCARHTEWGKLTVDEVRFEMTDNSDRMRDLERDERDVRDRAAIRSKARKYGGEEGHAEMHNITNGVHPEAMDVDAVG